MVSCASVDLNIYTTKVKSDTRQHSRHIYLNNGSESVVFYLFVTFMMFVTFVTACMQRFWCKFLLFSCRVQPRPSKGTSYSAVSIWLRSSPNSTTSAPPLQTGSGSMSTSQTSKRASRVSSSFQLERYNKPLGLCLMTFLVWQVSGAVQAGQSVRQIHPGSPQERKQRVLQAQEQPPAGGVSARNSIVFPPSTILQCSDWINTEPPPPTPKTLVSRTITPVPTMGPKMTVQLFELIVFCQGFFCLFFFSLFLSELPWHHYSCNHVPPFFWQRKPLSGLHMPQKFGEIFIGVL